MLKLHDFCNRALARLVRELDWLDLPSDQIGAVESERDALIADASETAPQTMLDAPEGDRPGVCQRVDE